MEKVHFGVSNIIRHADIIQTARVSDIILQEEIVCSVDRSVLTHLIEFQQETRFLNNEHLKETKMNMIILLFNVFQKYNASPHIQIPVFNKNI